MEPSDASTDLFLRLLGACEFWTFAAAGAWGLVVYGILKSLGAPDEFAGGTAVTVGLIVWGVLIVVMCG